jgi:predicted ATPase
VDLAPITVVYGPNGSGKSSLLYALLSLKSIVLQSNQQVQSFFNYGFANLGGFREVVYGHQSGQSIDLSLRVEDNGQVVSYEANLRDSSARLRLALGDRLLELDVSFPYSANQQAEGGVKFGEKEFPVSWNGISAEVALEDPNETSRASDLVTLLNTPLEILRGTSVVPLRRGFSRPSYSVVPVSALLVTEEELAALLAREKYLVAKISFYAEQILQRDFRVFSPVGTGVFSLDATDKRTGVSSELVNDGFGVNQLIFMLAKALHDEAKLVCVEEPEIHLHPTAVRALANAFVRIMRNEGKRFLISTHSEGLVLALLGAVVRRECVADELAFYLAKKEGTEAIFERQEVTSNGQLAGGLSSFMESEMEDVKAFLGVAE